MSIKAKVGRDSMRTFTTGAVASVFSILTGVIIARTLGPSGKGIYSGVQLLHTAVLSVSSGVGGAITYYLTKRAQPITALIPALLRILLMVCCLAWAALALWALLRGITTVQIIFMVVVPASVVLSWQPAIFISLDRIKNLNYQNVGLALTTLVAVSVVLLVFHAGTSAAIIAWVICVYGTALVVIAFTIKAVRAESRASEPVALAQLLSFGFRSSLTGALSFMNSRVDSLIVIGLIGISGFGIYSMATGIAEVLYMISQALGTSIARSIGVSDFHTSALITAKAIRLNTIVVGLVSALLFAFAPFLIDKVYGRLFDPAAAPLRILLPGLVIFSATRIFNSFFTYQLGRPMFAVYLLAAVTMLQIAGCFVFIPRVGLAGAALASTAAYLVATLGQTWYFCKVSSLPVSSVWLPTRSDAGQLWNSAGAIARNAHAK
ncbi:MAG: polysaccharide biosynthesis C-terminal domain-containing protein [Candidatus Eremiobacter antarcticus]|nr:polysaccharide biosynthesis C-terminal domain-containing protein [Candidatus Eremiobacteraeota bacterium]